MFGRIADRYDLMNTLMTAGQDRVWRAAVARSLNGAHDVLDVGTGTGKLAATVERYLPGARVVGVDFSEPMLHASTERVPLLAGDALRLPFADERFDAVVSAFLLRNLADAEAGIAEQTRVLRQGGRLVVLETAPARVFELAFRYVLPVLGGTIAGDASAYRYLPESTLAFKSPERVAELMRTAGLRVESIERRGLGSVAITVARKE